MKKTYHSLFFVIFLCTLSACSDRKINPPEPTVQELVQKAFSQRDFAINFQLDKRPKKEFTILYEKKVKDSLKIKQNLFRINPEKSLINPKNIISIELDSIDVNSRTLAFEHVYYPSLTTKLHAKYTFIYQGNNWVLTQGGIIISDGWYELPKY